MICSGSIFALPHTHPFPPSNHQAFFECFSFDFSGSTLLFGESTGYFEVLHICRSVCLHLKSIFCFPPKFSSLFLQATFLVLSLCSKLFTPGSNLILVFTVSLCFSAALFDFVQRLSSILSISIDFFVLEFSLPLQSARLYLFLL